MNYKRINLKWKPSKKQIAMGTLFQFMKKLAVWTAIILAIIFIFVGIKSPIEPGMSVFGHVLKTFFGCCWVTMIVEVIMYSFGQFLYAWIEEKKENFPNDKWWFFKGVWEDIKRIWHQITWKRVGFVVGFFAIVLFIFYILELVSTLV